MVFLYSSKKAQTPLCLSARLFRTIRSRLAGRCNPHTFLLARMVYGPCLARANVRGSFVAATFSEKCRPQTKNPHFWRLKRFNMFVVLLRANPLVLMKDNKSKGDGTNKQSMHCGYCTNDHELVNRNFFRFESVSAKVSVL